MDATEKIILWSIFCRGEAWGQSKHFKLILDLSEYYPDRFLRPWAQISIFFMSFVMNPNLEANV